MCPGLLSAGRVQLRAQLVRGRRERIVPAAVDADGNIPEADRPAEHLALVEILGPVECSGLYFVVLAGESKGSRHALKGVPYTRLA